MKKTDIAIVGMSCVFPGAKDAETFWQNIINRVDSTQTVPENRIDRVHFETGSSGVDRFYCNRGGFIPDFEFDPARFGILPLAVEGTEPDHLLTLSLVHKALEDAGVLERNVSLERTGIIIGKGNYTGPGATRAIEIIRTGEQIVNVLKELLPDLGDEEIEKVKKEFQLRKGRFGPDTAMGLIPNLVASLVANRFNLGGVAYTLDAACASSLIAIDHAVQELNSNRCDMVIAGGVHVGQNAAFWSIFTQLGALSKKGKISPFDEKADGLLIGEGCGFVVLKRLEDAIKDNDKIYAVLKGIGISSDGSGTSVMSPSVKGQIRAISQAWKNAGTPVENIGYLEAHGTGTPLGDKTELETLRQFFGEDASLPKAGIGTVKSNIGHAMPASGIAGIIKTALALYHGIIPPTLHCDTPLTQMKGTRFSAVQQAIDWETSGLPKLAGVNAFGFGGINAHAVLEGYTAPAHQGNTKGQFAAAIKTETPTAEKQGREYLHKTDFLHQPEITEKQGAQITGTDPVLLLARQDLETLILAMETHDRTPGDGRYRIAIFDPTPERIKKAVKIASKNIPWRSKQDIWFSNEPLLSDGGKVAFVFPGLDGLSAGEVDSVAGHFNIPQENMDRTEGLLNDALKIFSKSSILDAALKQLGIIPDMAAGHSLGEWLASRSSGLVEESSIVQLLRNLDPETYELKDSRFIAIGCGIDQLQPLIEQIADLYLTNDNCPQQVILCGSHTALDQLVPVLKQRQIFHQVLPFQSGFHSPFIAAKLDIILEGMSHLRFNKTKFPLWSATTLELYPEAFDAIMQLSVEHLMKPVRFRELTERLYAEGARVFIQVGSGGLTGFIEDTLRGKQISTVSSNVSLRSGIAQLQRVLAALFAEGRVVRMELMGYEAVLMTPHAVTAEKTIRPFKKGITLQLGLPLLRNFPDLSTLAAQQQAITERKQQSVPAAQRETAAAGQKQDFKPGKEQLIPAESTVNNETGWENILNGRKEVLLEDLAHPLMQVFNENVEDMLSVQSELLRLFQNREITADLPAPVLHPVRAPFSMKLDISLENCPYIMDHCIMQQPAGWDCIADMDPVIPMTMIFELFAEIAAGQAPGEHVQKIMNIKVFQWMNVTQPFKETITGTWKNQHLVHLNLERFAEAEVLLTARHPKPPLVNFDTGRSLNISRTPEQIYEEHMFHGPGYQGIKKLIKVGDKGITGIIEGGAGKGSLLDNAGQLFGLWLQLTLPKDRIAFPVKIQEIEFFGDPADQQGSFECTCQLTELTEEFATADFSMKRGNQVWAIVTGWQNRRMGIDEPLWKVSMSPLHNHLSEEIVPGVFMFHQAYNRVASWDFVLKRYFNQAEKKHYESLMPNKKKEWMISRVAVKDAVKNLLARTKKELYYPIVFEIRSDELHQPYPYGSMTTGIHISIAHKGTDAVGIAQYDRPVGIDIESIEERSEGFYELVFSASERALLGGHEMDEWATRFWVAKEAYGKYLGKGLQGNPKAYIIEEIKGENLRINDIFIRTIKHKNYIIGWTQ